VDDKPIKEAKAPRARAESSRAAQRERRRQLAIAAGVEGGIAKPIGAGGPPARVMPATSPEPVVKAEGRSFIDEGHAMRTFVMELQGLKYGRLSMKEKMKEEEMRETTRGMVAKDVEDDYLAGPMSVESYVIFRTRPLIESYEKLSVRLATQLRQLELAGFVVNLIGAVMATSFVNFAEWLSLTVAICALLSGVVEFTQLKKRVVAVNLALGELHSLMVWWDALSVVRRRPTSVKAIVVETTERAVIQMVDALTTAASNTQTSVEMQLTHDRALPDGGVEELR